MKKQKFTYFVYSRDAVATKKATARTTTTSTIATAWWQHPCSEQEQNVEHEKINKENENTVKIPAPVKQFRRVREKKKEVISEE